MHFKMKFMGDIYQIDIENGRNGADIEITDLNEKSLLNYCF